jgi:hypothetical protein
MRKPKAPPAHGPASPGPAPRSTSSLPAGVVMVEIRVPVFTGELIGGDAQSSRHVDLQLSREGGLALSRMRAALERLLAESMGANSHLVRKDALTVTRADAFRHVTDAFAGAIAGARG